jgi:transposase InsO family protein
MSRKGNCWDNAVAESFFKTLKVERVYQTSYFSREQAKIDLFEYIEVWYNQQRLHSALDQKSIKQFESLVKKDYFRDVA